MTQTANDVISYPPDEEHALDVDPRHDFHRVKPAPHHALGPESLPVAR